MLAVDLDVAELQKDQSSMLRASGRNAPVVTQLALLSVMPLVEISCGVAYDVADRTSKSSAAGKMGGAGGVSVTGAAGATGSVTAGESGGGAFDSAGASGDDGRSHGGIAGRAGDSAITGAGQGGQTSTGASATFGGVGGLGGSGNTAGTNGGVGGTATTWSTSIVSCGIEVDNTGDRSKRKMLLRDDGTNRLGLVDVGNASASWFVDLGLRGRDLQLVGNCRVLVGTELGYEEYDLQSRQKAAELTTFPGTIAAHRLRNQNTVLVGVGQGSSPYQGSDGIVLIEVNESGTVVEKIVIPGTYYVRLVRPTPTGTFLISNNTRVIEADQGGTVQSPTFSVSATALPHVWKALRIPSRTSGMSETVVSTGNLASLTFFDQAGNFSRRITGGNASIVGGATAANPQFFSDFQILANGNFVVANSYEVGPGRFNDCIPILEYTPDGALAWYWGDPTYADRLSNIQGIIVLDGLDLSKLYVEDTNGQQVPVN